MPDQPPGSTPADLTLADLGEWNLIERLGRFAPPDQFLDDAALITTAPGNGNPDLVVNTDVLVETVHFSDRTTAPQDVGWRAAMANLSDLAAMGCTSVLGLTVGLVAPATTPWRWVEGVYEGLQEALEARGGLLLGGDCSSGRQRMLAITALGQLPPRGGGAILRSVGRPGDLLLASGAHGLSRLGLALLLDEPVPGLNRLNPDQRQALSRRAIKAHRRPQGRFDVVEELSRCQPPGTAWRVGGTDSSDGLLAAVTAIARASGCQAMLQRHQLPLEPTMELLEPAVAWCLSGGEDFELVLALEPSWARALQARVTGSRLIGTLTPARSAETPVIWAEDGTVIATDGNQGYTHFQNAPTAADAT
ncbi:MAG: thiamine-phosphate kinase [Cyanobacteriota bacterium]